MKEEFLARIAELEEQREKIVEQANAQINAISGAIQELQRIIKTLEGDEEEKE